MSIKFIKNKLSRITITGEIDPLNEITADFDINMTDENFELLSDLIKAGGYKVRIERFKAYVTGEKNE